VLGCKDHPHPAPVQKCEISKDLVPTGSPIKPTDNPQDKPVTDKAPVLFADLVITTIATCALQLILKF
jgi:hypothetical protein